MIRPVESPGEVSDIEDDKIINFDMFEGITAYEESVIMRVARSLRKKGIVQMESIMHESIRLIDVALQHFPNK